MLRTDLKTILGWIPAHSKILDLGCGEGVLLERLIKDKQCHGYGLETDAHFIQACIERKVPVIEQDLNQGLGNFKTQNFDIVIMTQALQVMTEPHLALEAMLRVGKQAIVTFPNFGNWKNRLYLGLKGRMPVSKSLPYAWYDTPNIHLCTFKDFEAFCQAQRIHILQRSVVNDHYQTSYLAKQFPNVFGETILYRLSKISTLITGTKP